MQLLVQKRVRKVDIEVARIIASMSYSTRLYLLHNSILIQILDYYYIYKPINKPQFYKDQVKYKIILTTQ